MNQNLTELVFIIDRSGSMHGLESDTIGGFNSVIKKQKTLPGAVNVTTVFFNHTVTLMHDRIPLSAVRPLKDEDYSAEGSTALMDAIGSSIDKIVNVQKQMREDGAGHVQFVIITDGFENSSRNYRAADIRKSISVQRDRYGWDFIFLGANIDAITAAAEIGIHSERAVKAVNDAAGIALQYEAVSCAIEETRCHPSSSGDRTNWKKKVVRDTEERGRR